MPRTNRHTAWLPPEDKELLWCCEKGMGSEGTAVYLNHKCHDGHPVRNGNAISNRRAELGYKVAKVLAERTAPIQGTREQEVERTESEKGIVLKSNGSRIRTVEELLAHAEVDTARYVVTKQTVKTWDTTMKVEGSETTIQNFAIHVEVAPKSGPNALEAVQAVIDGAFGRRVSLQVDNRTRSISLQVGKGDLMQAVVIADPHLAKLAWAKETGHQDYDLSIACRTLKDASGYLLERGEREKVATRHLYLLGDVFHFDTPAGTTTKGTPLERDGRVQKMIQNGSQALFDIIEESAKQVPTHLVLVSGNHDEILTWALQQILQSQFRHDRRITVDSGFTARKYVSWGKCLLGLTHGDKAKKVLPGLMAREAPEFSAAKLREIHRGHLHYRKETDTVEGVLIRQHPSLSPPDAWHAAEGFVSDRGQDAIIYHKDGAVVATHSYTPGLK